MDIPKYDPNIHCCEYFYKDICTCVQNSLKASRKRKKTRNVNGTLRFLKANDIVCQETSTTNVISVMYKDQKLYVSLKKDKNGLIKCRFEGNNKWYTYGKEKLVHMLKYT